MTAFAWTILYEEALRSDPEDLLERIQTAAQSIIDRLQTLGLANPQTHLNEHRALCLALSDFASFKDCVFSLKPVAQFPC